MILYTKWKLLCFSLDLQENWCLRVVEHFICLKKREFMDPLATIGCRGDRYWSYCNNRLRDHSEIMSRILGKFFIN